MTERDASLEVLYEDNHLLVVDKPPLLATMGVSAGEDSLVERARQYLKEKYNKPGNVYVGVVSRLDSFTSGVIVLARTSKAAARLNSQFQAGTVHKRYLAVVPAGVPDSASWSDQLVKDEANHRMKTVQPGQLDFDKSKQTQLEFSKLSTKNEMSLVDIRLLTGRKHQIRVQFSSRGFPIIGDRKYGSKVHFAPGIPLRSYFVSFEHPTLKSRINVTGKVPSKWPFDQVIRNHLKNLEDPGNISGMC